MGRAEQLLAATAAGSATTDPEARSLAAAALRDTLAIGVAGLAEPAALAVRRTLEPVATGHGARAWSGDDRYTTSDVVLHGTACHALDWDDYMHPMHGHCSSVLLPAAWTLSKLGHVSGQRLVDAYLVGYQVDWLASLVLSHGHYRRGWHATSTIGVLGAAAAAAHLLGLDEAACAAALGIAASSASGLQVNFGTPTKALHAGLAARAGVQAAQLAAAGMRANEHWLTGQHGMLAAYGGDVPATGAADVVASGLEGPHGITTAMGLVQKPWSSCGCSHATVDAVVALTGDLDVDTIERIEVHVDPAVTRTMRETEPRDPFAARYSVSWVAAVAAADGAAGPAQFAPESLARTDVRALRERVAVIDDLVVGDDDRFAARVVVSVDGAVRETKVPHAQGHPANRMAPEVLRAKQLAALALVSDEPERLVALVDTVPTVDDVADLADDLRTALG